MLLIVLTLKADDTFVFYAVISDLGLSCSVEADCTATGGDEVECAHVYGSCSQGYCACAEGSYQAAENRCERSKNDQFC